jgi:hypothetical protein
MEGNTMRLILLLAMMPAMLAVAESPDEVYSNRVSNLRILYQAARMFTMDSNGKPLIQLDDLVPYLPREGVIRGNWGQVKYLQISLEF